MASMAFVLKIGQIQRNIVGANPFCSIPDRVTPESLFSARLGDSNLSVSAFFLISPSKA